MAETFGQTIKAPNEIGCAGQRIWGCKFQSGSAGTLQSISVYIKKSTGGPIKCAIYDSDKDLLADGTTEAKTVETGQDDWMIFNFLTPPTILALTDYYLCWYLYNTDNFYFDAGSSNQMFFFNKAYDGWPSSIPPTGYEDWEFSIYATYYEAPPPSAKTLVQAALISLAPLVVLPTLAEILKFTGS